MVAMRLGRDGGDRQFLFLLPRPCQPCGRRLLATSSRQVLLLPRHWQMGMGGEGSKPFSFHSWHGCSFSDKPDILLLLLQL